MVGAIFLAVIVLGGIGIAVIVVRGTALDKECRAYVDAAIPPIATTWNKKELFDRASPELKKKLPVDELDRLFRWSFSGLGRMQKCEPAKGQAGYNYTSETEKGSVLHC